MTHDFASTMDNAWPWCEHCGRDRYDHEVTAPTSGDLPDTTPERDHP